MMLKLITSPILFRVLSLAGTLFVVLGAVITGMYYRGKAGEHYSILNHFISELGEKGVSRLAVAFNAGLILGGVCLLPACISLGLILPGVWSKVGLTAGVISAISLALVGVYSMDRLEPHARAAITYFRTGLAMVTFFSLAILLQNEPVVIQRQFSLAGLPAILSFGSFLTYSSVLDRRKKETDTEGEEDRPRPHFWGIAFVEWMIFLTTVPFFLLLAFGI